MAHDSKKTAEDPQEILRHNAAKEASLDVQIEQGLRQIEFYYNAQKEADRRIAEKEEESKKWDELTEMKKQELDKQVKELDGIRRDREQFQRSTEQLQSYIKILKRDEIERQRRREANQASWERIIAREKEKMSSYPLVIEKKKLENELLAASVELGILKYRVKEERKRRQQMEDIERLKLNNAMIELAQDYFDVKKLAGRKKFLLEELERLKESDQLSESRSEQIQGRVTVTEFTTSSNICEVVRDLPTNEEQFQRQSKMSLTNVDDLLENFRQMNTIKKSLVSDLPPILSQTFEIAQTKNVESNLQRNENKESSHVPSLNVNDLLKNVRYRYTASFRGTPTSSRASPVLSEDFQNRINSPVNDPIKDKDQVIPTTTVNDDEKSFEGEELSTQAEEKSSTGSNRDYGNSFPDVSAQFDYASTNMSRSKMSVSKFARSVHHPYVLEDVHSSLPKKARIPAAKMVRTNSPLPMKNTPRPKENSNQTNVQAEKRHQQKVRKTDDVFIAKKLLSSQEESLNVVNQIQKRTGVKFHPSIQSGYSDSSYASVKKPSRIQNIHYAPEVQDETNRYQTAENNQTKDTIEKNNYVTSTYFDGMEAPITEENGSNVPLSEQDYMFVEDGGPNVEDMYMIPDDGEYSNQGSNNDIASMISATGSGSKHEFAGDDFAFNFGNRSNSNDCNKPNYDGDDVDIFGFANTQTSSEPEQPFSFLQPSRKSNSNNAPTFFFN